MPPCSTSSIASVEEKEGGEGSQEGSIKLLYLTPEKFKNSPKMKNVLSRLYEAGKLSRFVIDEAHCLVRDGGREGVL